MPGEGRPHRQRMRLDGYDYREAGAYFVTIVAEGRRCVFGSIVDQEMVLNEAGWMVQDEWHALTRRFPTIETGAFTIMPNHVHGIVILHAPTKDEAADRAARADGGVVTRAGPALGEIVGAFKSATTVRYIKGLRELGWQPFDRRLWQRNYYDRVIRNEHEWQRIHTYIEANPAQWSQDSENPACSP